MLRRSCWLFCGACRLYRGACRLICEACGQQEAGNYFWSCAEGGTYTPTEESCNAIRAGMFAAVVSKDRVGTIIPSVYRTNQYMFDPYAALAYGALADYRARKGMSTRALILCEWDPRLYSETIAKSISSAELKSWLENV